MTVLDPYNSFGFLTNRVGRQINGICKKQIENQGYTFAPSCVGILAELWIQDGINQKEIGNSLIKKKSSITKMLRSLEKDNMIIRKLDSTDQRNKLIFLTKKGKDFKKSISNSIRRTEKLLHHAHSTEEIETAKSVLFTLYSTLSDQ